MVVGNMSQIFYQLKDIIYPINGKRQVMVSLLYFINSLIVTILTLFSFKYKKSKLLVFVTMSLLTMKTELRLYDFEGTKEIMGSKKWIVFITFNKIAGIMY